MLWELGGGRAWVGWGQPGTASFPRELRYVPSWRCSASHLGIPHVQSDWCPSTPQPSFQRQASVLRDTTITSGLFNEGKHVQSLHVASPMLGTAGGTRVGAGSSLGEWDHDITPLHISIKRLSSQDPVTCIFSSSLPPCHRGHAFQSRLCQQSVPTWPLQWCLCYVSCSKSVLPSQWTHLAESSHTGIRVNSHEPPIKNKSLGSEFLISLIVHRDILQPLPRILCKPWPTDCHKHNYFSQLLQNHWLYDVHRSQRYWNLKKIVHVKTREMNEWQRTRKYTSVHSLLAIDPFTEYLSQIQEQMDSGYRKREVRGRFPIVQPRGPAHFCYSLKGDERFKFLQVCFTGEIVKTQRHYMAA